MLLFVLVVICCVFCVLVYVEFVLMVLVFGSVYIYIYVIFGEFLVWFIGWMLVFEYGVFVLVVVVSWIGYFFSLFS